MSNQNDFKCLFSHLHTILHPFSQVFVFTFTHTLTSLFKDGDSREIEEKPKDQKEESTSQPNANNDGLDKNTKTDPGSGFSKTGTVCSVWSLSNVWFGVWLAVFFSCTVCLRSRATRYSLNINRIYLLQQYSFCSFCSKCSIIFAQALLQHSYRIN